MITPIATNASRTQPYIDFALHLFKEVIIHLSLIAVIMLTVFLFSHQREMYIVTDFQNETTFL